MMRGSSPFRPLVISSSTLWPMAVALVAIILSGAQAVGAVFDYPSVLECRDITPLEGESQYADRNLIEVKLRISVRFRGNEVKHVEEINIDVDGTPDHFKVLNFSPSTELSSEWSEDIERTTTREKSSSADATLGGGLPIPAGELVAHVTPSISGGFGRRETATETTSRRPPKQAVVVSGTTHQGRGVFFKMRQSSQTTLEGVHDLSITFIAPANWQSGHLHLACNAHGRHKILGLVEQSKNFGHVAAPVEIHLPTEDDTVQNDTSTTN